MKDIFILEGKKYISSRRASEISGYATDYIGQLCRAGKLDARMVGRTWFVTEQSLHLHKANIAQSELTRNRIDNLRGSKVAAQVEVTSSVTSSVETTPVASVAPVAPVAEVAPIVDVITKPEVRLTYEADNRPLGPVISKPTSVIQTVSTPVASVIDSVATPVASPYIYSVPAQKTSYLKLTRSIILRRALTSGAVMIALLFVTSITIDVMNSSTGTSNQASVGNIVAGIFSSFGGVYNSLFGRDTSSLALNSEDTLTVASEPTPTTASTTMNGMAVVPSSGNSAQDEMTKQRIQETFSDNVTVQADKSGTAGVITPIFKHSNGDNFMYVLVPVKDKPLSSINDKSSP